MEEGLYAYLEKIDPAIARLYFVGDDGEVPIPTGVEVIDIINGGVLVKPLPKTNSYALCWTDNYLVKWKGVNLLETFSTRQWTVTGRFMENVQYDDAI